MMLAIAGWSLTACDESHDDWTQPTVYPQEPEVVIEGFSATPTQVAESTIDLGGMADGDSVQLFNFVQGTLPDGVKLENIRLEAKPADQPTATAAKVAASADGKVTKEELAKLVYTFYGKKATVRTFEAALYANAVKDLEAQLITLGAPFKLYLKPEKLEDPYYYAYGRATLSTADDAYKFVMTPVEDNDMAYTYTTKFTGIGGDLLVWNINYWTNDRASKDFSKVYAQGEAAKDKMSGTVNQGPEEGKATPTFFNAPQKNKFFTFTIDLEKLTYTWTLLEDQSPVEYAKISLIGINNDWNNDIDLATYGSANKHNWYLRYTFATDTQLKFRANHAWPDAGGADWGYGDADGAWNAGSEWAKICTNGAKNIMVTAGTYDIYFCDITGAAHFVPVEVE